jgi:hypothetical protein
MAAPDRLEFLAASPVIASDGRSSTQPWRTVVATVTDEYFAAHTLSTGALKWPPHFETLLAFA